MKTTFSIGLITLFASVHLTSNTMVAAQENSYSTNQNTQSYTETSIIETTTTKVYEEIIEESGEVTPGAPGSFDDDTTTPETTEPLETEPPTETTVSSVEVTDSTDQSPAPESSTTTSINQGTAPGQTETTSFITRIITGNKTTANNARNQGKLSKSDRPLFKESQAHSLTKLFLKKYLQTNIETYSDVKVWSYALLTVTTGKTEWLNPDVVMPLVVTIAEILTNY